MARRGLFSDFWRVRLPRMLRAISKAWTHPDRLLTTLAIIIGCVTGFGAVAFSRLVSFMEEFYYDDLGGQILPSMPWLLLLLPMSGAILVGLITYFFAPEAEGHGVPEVMDAMIRKGGRIRPRVAGAKAVASALTIGSGGSAGTEGPIIQIGAAIGSGFGQWLRVSLADIRVLIGCGAASGIASIFNAPIAGVLFAVEVLLRDVSLRSFLPIIMSAVLSSTITQAIGGNEPIFPIPTMLTGTTSSPIYVFTVQEFGNYAVLGLVCGLVAVAFMKALYLSEDLFRKLPVHRIIRPVIGAAMLALLALGVNALLDEPVSAPPSPLATESATHHPPPIMGNGYPIIRRTLEKEEYPHASEEVVGSATPAAGPPRHSADWTIGMLLVLLVAKVLATCFTLGSGGSGGVFAPSLFVGATTGGAFGLFVQQLGIFEGITPGAYALVGMAAVVAASIHAPLTATLMLFELTHDYKVIIPIMLAGVIGLAVSTRIDAASIYTLKLLRRGVRLSSGDSRILQRIPVREIPRISAPLVSPLDPVDKLVNIMRTTTAHDFVVVDEKGRIVGMVLGDDLRTMLLEAEAMPLLTVSDIVRHEVPTVNLDETLDVVLNRFAGKPMHALPVVDPESPDTVTELITRAAVMNRYNQVLATT